MTKPKLGIILPAAGGILAIVVPLMMAQVKIAEAIGLSVLEIEIVLETRWGDAPTAFEIVSGMGAYFLTTSAVVLTLAAPLVALKK